HLQMCENQRINKYIVEFNRLASQVKGWGDGALHHQFYKGLPACIKDEISHVRKPSTLSKLRTLTQTIDSRYWERKNEVSRESTSHSKPSMSSNSTSTPKTTSSMSAAKPQHNHSSKNTSSSGSSSGKSGKPAPDLSSKLGKDGKLTQEEQKRR
ncbi:hypothetical protein BV22DRAFT_993897, partial [Leucogyrophana mollusca]